MFILNDDVFDGIEVDGYVFMGLVVFYDLSYTYIIRL